MCTAASCVCQSFGTEEGCWQVFPGIPQATWPSSGGAGDPFSRLYGSDKIPTAQNAV